MPLPSRMRAASLLAAGALTTAVVTVAPPAANAAPVFVDANTQLDPFSTYYVAGGNCTGNGTADAAPSVPVVENGPAVSATGSVSATYAHTVDATDNATFSASTTATGRVTSSGGNPKTFDFSAQGNFALAQQLPTSACPRGGYAGVDLDFRFTVSQAGFLEITTKNRGSRTYGEVWVEQVNPTGDELYVDSYGWGLRFNSNTKVLLPPGTYEGYFESEAYIYQNTSLSGSGSTTVHGEFTVAGARTAAVSGKGKRYVSMPSARSCASHNLAVKVTTKRKLANKVKQVRFFVNDKLVKKVKTPNKGATVTLPVADEDTADVVAAVKLFPRKKGQPGKVVEVGSSYEACS